eukprot:SAG11_NODE_972_length_6340_cov_3.043423_3_plen_453_part_00
MELLIGFGGGAAAGGVDRLTSIPNGKNLTTPPGGFLLETHGPYQHGGGDKFPAVNGAPSDTCNMCGNLPVDYGQGHTDGEVFIGLGQKNIFASEFGSSVYSSFESMAPTLAKEHWGVHGGAPPDTCHGGFASHCEGSNTMSQRNYACDNIIVSYFGKAGQEFDAVGEQVFKKQLWQCMVGQALLIKSDIEARRATNQFGIIVWQLNEIWPTGGWGSIEYGTVGYTKGQVLGGRWKPLHHWYKASIYADIAATCGVAGKPDEVAAAGNSTLAATAGGTICYVKNDSPNPFKGNVKVDAVDFASGKSTSVKSLSVDMQAGAGVIQWFTLDKAVEGSEEMLLVTVTGAAGAVESSNPVAFATPAEMKLPKATVTAKAATVGAAEVGDSLAPVEITVTADKFALYVTLTTVAQGRFEDNAFVMLPGTKTIKFFPFEGFEMAELTASLRVEHAASYM